MASINAPRDMSYVNVWYALYKNAGVKNFSQFDLLEKEESVLTAEKVAALFQNYPTNKSPLFYMEYAGGRYMKVHFCDFPQLDVFYYDREYGQGAAQRALNSYNTVPPEKRFDKNDRYSFTELQKLFNKRT